MWAITWRLIVAMLCLFLFMFPLLNLLTFWFAVPVGIYCVVSAVARIWKRNTVAA